MHQLKYNRPFCVIKHNLQRSYAALQCFPSSWQPRDRAIIWYVYQQARSYKCEWRAEHVCSSINVPGSGGDAKLVWGGTYIIDLLQTAIGIPRNILNLLFVGTGFVQTPFAAKTRTCFHFKFQWTVSSRAVIFNSAFIYNEMLSPLYLPQLEVRIDECYLIGDLHEMD